MFSTKLRVAIAAIAATSALAAVPGSAQAFRPICADYQLGAEHALENGNLWIAEGAPYAWAANEYSKVSWYLGELQRLHC